MLNNLETLLQSAIGSQVTVNLLDGSSTGTTGTLDRVGADYLFISAGRSTYLIPFNAIAMIVPTQALS
jgi:hypothetical protein